MNRLPALLTAGSGSADSCAASSLSADLGGVPGRGQQEPDRQGHPPPRGPRERQPPSGRAGDRPPTWRHYVMPLPRWSIGHVQLTVK
jgi:hypothetical protein